MKEESERLLALLNDRRTAKPPFWEPWFGMTSMLNQFHGGDYLRLAQDLHLAAAPLRGLNPDVQFLAATEQMKDTGVWYGGGALREPSQLRERPEPDWDAQIAPLLAQRRSCADAGIACWMVIPWCFHVVGTSMGLEYFALQCYDRPEFIHEVMQWVEARNQHAIERVVRRVRPDFVLYDGDCAYKTATMIQPSQIREFCVEPTRPNMARLKDLGIPAAFHTDGKLDDVIPILVDLGIAAVHGCESQANDLGDLVERFGDRIALCGNTDVIFLKNATPDEVRRKTAEMLRIGSRRQRFIAGCNTSPLDYIPVANYRAMAEAIADFQPDRPAQSPRQTR